MTSWFYLRRDGRSPRRKEHRQRSSRTKHLRSLSRRNEREAHQETLTQGVINTIIRGFAKGGSSTSVRKRHLRSVQAVNSVTTRIQRRMSSITFTYENFKAIEPKQDDPMVITITIDLCWSRELGQHPILENIQKVTDTRDQDPTLWWSDCRVFRRVSEFIDLYTKFGEGRLLSMTIKIHYLLVDANTLYNILLGRL